MCVYVCVCVYIVSCLLSRSQVMCGILHPFIHVQIMAFVYFFSAAFNGKVATLFIPDKVF